MYRYKQSKRNERESKHNKKKNKIHRNFVNQNKSNVMPREALQKVLYIKSCIKQTAVMKAIKQNTCVTKEPMLDEHTY